MHIHLLVTPGRFAPVSTDPRLRPEVKYPRTYLMAVGSNRSRSYARSRGLELRTMVHARSFNVAIQAVGPQGLLTVKSSGGIVFLVTILKPRPESHNGNYCVAAWLARLFSCLPPPERTSFVGRVLRRKCWSRRASPRLRRAWAWRSWERGRGGRRTRRHSEWQLRPARRALGARAGPASDLERGPCGARRGGADRCPSRFFTRSKPI